MIRRRSHSAQARPARITLPEALKPAELSSASPSSLASIANIEAEVAAPPQLIDTPKFAPLSQLATIPQPASNTQSAPTPQLAHAPQQTLAPKPNATNVAATPSLAPAFAPAPMPSLLARAANVPLVKLAANAPSSLVGRDSHKFSSLPVPRNWQNVSSTMNGEFKFSLRAVDGRSSGVAVWSRVGLAGNAIADRRNKTLVGVSHASLRRTVIDRMLLEGGWVVNDFEREIAGQKVFVVVAQSEQGGARRFWTYYFVEVEGQLFSLATTVPNEFADAVAADAEQTISTLGSRQRAAAQH
jgi:hypothetical protein